MPRTTEQLEAGLDEVRRSPREVGVLAMIVRRPRTNEREVLSEARLDVIEGLVGDNWWRGNGGAADDDAAQRETQITIMNARAIALVEPNETLRPAAGDQLYVDLDLSVENLPPGTRLAVGEAIVEVTAEPHNGCKKFAARFGKEAVRFVNSPVGKQLRLRGLNAKVVHGGTIRVGDAVTKLPTS